MESHVEQFEVNFVENEGIKRKNTVKILIFTEHNFFYTLSSQLIIFLHFNKNKLFDAFSTSMKIFLLCLELPFFFFFFQKHWCNTCN